MADLWHKFSAEELFRTLGTDHNGLPAEEATRRLIEHGLNELPHKEGRGPLAMLAAQFADFLILLLLAAAAVSWWVGDAVDALAILAIVILNAIIGFSELLYDGRLGEVPDVQREVLADGRERGQPRQSVRFELNGDATHFLHLARELHGQFLACLLRAPNCLPERERLTS